MSFITLPCYPSLERPHNSIYPKAPHPTDDNTALNFNVVIQSILCSTKSNKEPSYYCVIYKTPSLSLNTTTITRSDPETIKIATYQIPVASLRQLLSHVISVHRPDVVLP